VDSQVADSACSATAYLGGVKANIGTAGVTGRVKVDDCAAMRNTSNHVSSILKWSQVRIAVWVLSVQKQTNPLAFSPQANKSAKLAPTLLV
jgi:alkaline phosphatase